MTEPASPAQLTSIVASAQNTLSLAANQTYVVDAPATATGRRARTWWLKNLGPADVWLRWDGGDAAIDDPQSIVLEAGEIIPGLVFHHLSLCCARQPGGGARVSFAITS
jgi:hypothetical protein